MQNKGKQKLAVNYHYVDHHIEILGLDRDYGNVDVHEQAMLSTNTEERPIEKHAAAGTLSIRKCMIGSFFYDSSSVSLFNRARPLGVIKNEDSV